jgi:3',5'-cyclic AMP phosphodiesterase CpdA
VILAQISDTHILAKDSPDPAAESRADNLRRCIADINRQRVDAVIHTGDSVHHAAADEYAHLREILSELEAPLFFTPGNRDDKSTLRDALDGIAHMPITAGFAHYAVEDYPVRLVALDSVLAGERKGVFCADRLAWLDATLSRAPDTPTLLFMHHPPFDILPDYEDGYRNAQDRVNLAAVVGLHKQVLRLLCGHVHRLHHESWAGTIATIMPSVAVDLRKGMHSGVGADPAYLLHRISDEGRLVTLIRIVRD